MDATAEPHTATFVAGCVWGVEAEPSSLQRVAELNYTGNTNFTDWYYPNAGPSVTSASGRCVSSVCTAGNVGAACTSDAQCAQSIGLEECLRKVAAELRLGEASLPNRGKGLACTWKPTKTPSGSAAYATR